MAKSLLSLDEYVQGVLRRDPVILARAVTLVESTASQHRPLAQEMLEKLLPHSGKAIRVGISGVPGAGKSTFIERFGKNLCSAGHRVAVLAIDPSSSLSGGSILGDKTRMEELSRDPNAFIRPTPSSGTLGGVARKTRETMLVCEAAGFDVILVETVGVGQSESTVRWLVDFFLLLMITGAGDELQGFKKGIIELADAIVINKADGDNTTPAERLKGEFNQVLGFFSPVTPGWTPRAYTCSARSGAGIEQIWEVITSFQKAMRLSGVFEERRRQQLVQWMEALVVEGFRERFLGSASVQQRYEQARHDVAAGKLSATAAAEQLLETSCPFVAQKQSDK